MLHIYIYDISSLRVKVEDVSYIYIMQYLTSKIIAIKLGLSLTGTFFNRLNSRKFFNTDPAP